MSLDTFERSHVSLPLVSLLACFHPCVIELDVKANAMRDQTVAAWIRRLLYLVASSQPYDLIQIPIETH